MDDDENEIRRIQDGLEKGRPVQTFYVDVPLSFGVIPTGEFVMDFPFEILGFDRAAMMRVRWSDLAAEYTLRALEEWQRNRDGRDEISPTPVAH